MCSADKTIISTASLRKRLNKKQQRETGSGVHRNFSGGGGGVEGFRKQFENFFDLYFLGRPICFSELSKNTIRKQFCQKFPESQAKF